MLTRTKYRALSPGEWARVLIPNYAKWREKKGMCSPDPGDEVDICIMPIYGPRYDSEHSFHWTYHVAWRSPGSTWSHYQGPDGSSVCCPWDFGLHECTKFYYDSQEQHELWDGKGKYLYKPASDDPELCPGGDHSAYQCCTCEKYVKPFSNDRGELVCPFCDVQGLVILDEETLDRLDAAREFARSIGLSGQLERQLGWLHNYARHDGSPKRQCVLSQDFAPHSFCFGHYVLPADSNDGKRAFWFNGGLIYQGLSCPADGSFPSLTVSLSSGTGWFCHT